MIAMTTIMIPRDCIISKLIWKKAHDIRTEAIGSDAAVIRACSGERYINPVL